MDQNPHHRVAKIVIDVSLHWLYAHSGNVEAFVGYLSMAVHMRSRSGCKIQIVGCQSRKDQESFETYVHEKSLCRTRRTEFLQYRRIAREMEETRMGDTFFDSLFES